MQQCNFNQNFLTVRESYNHHKSDSQAKNKNIMDESINNLQDLLIEQARKLYNAEKQQLNALTRMQELATARELRLAIKSHIDDTSQQINRLNEVLRNLDVSSFGTESETTRELIREGYSLIDRCTDSEVMDAAIISIVQQIEHLEIVGYGLACTYANELGFKEIADQLHLSLVEEKELDSWLTEIATEQINKKAITPIVT